MEKVLNADDKIRRAEEIYYRRKMQSNNREIARVNVGSEKKDFGLLKKMFLQIMICVVIYLIIYLVQSTNYIFSGEVVKKTKDILNYDINIGYICKESFNYINELFDKKEQNSEDNDMGKNIVENNENIEETPSETQEEPIQEENIGGENIVITDENLSEAEKDIKYILDTKSLIVPLKGTITSRFGPRNSANPKVSKYHTGIDIAVNEGSTLIASMGGTVTLVSNEGNYGVHTVISNGDVETLYAHCKSIYVKEGDEVSQGQEIGQTGATGNVTGPHLHFEIKREGRYIDPDAILQF